MEEKREKELANSIGLSDEDTEDVRVDEEARDKLEDEVYGKMVPLNDPNDEEKDGKGNLRKGGINALKGTNGQAGPNARVNAGNAGNTNSNSVLEEVKRRLPGLGTGRGMASINHFKPKGVGASHWGDALQKQFE